MTPASLRILKALSVGGVASLVLVACGGGGGGTTQNLASDQTLRFPVVDDVGDLDPAHLSAAVDIHILPNTYSGLYKVHDQLNQVPDIPSGPPTISTDGMTSHFQFKQ